jgi:hypothetical protein
MSEDAMEMPQSAGQEHEASAINTADHSSKGRRRPNGLGHNSRNAPDTDPNVSAETIPNAMSAAEHEINTFVKTETDCESIITPITHSAICAVGTAVQVIEHNGGLAEFYRVNSIRPHGNVRNFYQPLVAFLFRHHNLPSTRQNIWRWSAVIFVAAKTGVTQEAMPGWLQRLGIEKIMNQYKELINGTDKAEELSNESLAEGICQAKGEDTAIPSTQLIRSIDGKRLALIDCNASIGEWHLVSLLSFEEDRVMKIMAADARNRLSRGK